MRICAYTVCKEGTGGDEGANGEVSEGGGGWGWGCDTNEVRNDLLIHF